MLLCMKAKRKEQRKMKGTIICYGDSNTYGYDPQSLTGGRYPENICWTGILQEKTGAKYPFLIPDTTMMNGRLQGISAFPETFFVDKDGNIVGDTYTGSHTLDEWKEIVEKELKNVSK